MFINCHARFARTSVRASVLAMVLSAILVPASTAAPNDGVRAIGDFAVASFRQTIGECVDANATVQFVAGDHLQNPIGNGKPGPWSDVVVWLRIYDTCPAPDRLLWSLEGFAVVPEPDIERLEHASLDGFAVRLVDAANTVSVDSVIDLDWTRDGDATVLKDHQLDIGHFAQGREVTARVDGGITFGDSAVAAGGLAFAASDLEWAAIGWWSLIDLPQQSACVPAPVGLTGWWTGDGTTSDRVGAHDATLQGDARFGPGLVDDAFVLDGDGDYVDVAHAPELAVDAGDFTVSLWVRFRTTRGEQVLVEKWTQQFETPSSGWTLTKLEGNEILLAVSSEDGAETGVASAPLALKVGPWHHMAARRTGSELAVFVDGVRVADGSLDPALSWDLDTPASLKFGARGGPDNTPGSPDDRGFFLDGAIDEVQLSVGRALSDADIVAGFEAGADGTCKGG